MLYADRTVTSCLHFSITPNAAVSNHRSLRRVGSQSIEGQPPAHTAKRKANNMHHNLHPGRLTWNLTITQLKRKIIFQTIIFRFHVNLPGCSCIIILSIRIPFIFQFSSQTCFFGPKENSAEQNPRKTLKNR